ncbi:WbqC family protein [Chryseobacterium sp. RR2-3-20]|uniref:WbqC family protein n=1 Tax=Chryseobacterium sp. RR2-3-20 TaxID=2787626 RepID=UPI001ADEE06A|nr:WbqC family protein [Chryseobacterium sp. RR2-3-20]
MKVAIMQPYFMPYIGYISLIKHVDLFILFDPVQFITHGWIERNRILKQNEGWLYIQVPLIKNNSRHTKIKNCLIDNTKDWKSKIKSQLQPYKKIAPHYYKVMALIDSIFSRTYEDIVTLNKISLEEICKYLGFPKELPVFSDMGLNIEEPQAADEWALNICKTISKNTTNKIHYINPIGGLDFFDRSKYASQDIELSFQKIQITPYNQKREPYELGLSILDVLMFNTPDEINVMLDQFELI